MTLISFEGPSKSGKTTIYNEVIKHRPEYVEIKGPRLTDIGLRDWMEYVKWEHAIKKPIFDANPDAVFIANRAFSEAVYATNPDVRQAMLRVYGAYDDAFIVYVRASKDELLERGTHDAWRLDDVLRRYDVLLSSMDHVAVDTTDQSIGEAYDEVLEAIDSML